MKRLNTEWSELETLVLQNPSDGKERKEGGRKGGVELDKCGVIFALLETLLFSVWLAIKPLHVMSKSGLDGVRKKCWSCFIFCVFGHMQLWVCCPTESIQTFPGISCACFVFDSSNKAYKESYIIFLQTSPRFCFLSALTSGTSGNTFCSSWNNLNQIRYVFASVYAAVAKSASVHSCLSIDIVCIHTTHRVMHLKGSIQHYLYLYGASLSARIKQAANI